MQGYVSWLFSVVSASAASLLIVAFLGKLIVTHWVEKAVNVHKEDLRRATEVELERLRALTAATKAEHEIMLARLQEKRARVIGSLYAKLVAAANATRFVVMTSFQSSELDAIRERASSRWTEAARYFERQRVWLPKECCDSTHGFLEKLQDLYWEPITFNPTDDGGAIGEYRKDYDRAAAWKMASEDLPIILEGLANQMRMLLDPRIPKAVQAADE
jgi:hypothetical protein